MIESNQLTWRTIENGFALHRWQTKTPLLHVVPDAVCLGMWRTRSPDGRLTDMANLTRAKDAAVCIALEILNSGKRGRQSRLGAAPGDESDAGVVATRDSQASPLRNPADPEPAR